MIKPCRTVRSGLTHLLSAAAVVLVLAVVSTTHAQCPNTSERAWPPGTQVTFHIDSNMSDAEQAGIRAAMALWNQENEHNGSGVSFVERFNPMQIPAALNFTNGVNPVTNADGSTGYASALTSKNSDPNGNLGSATITFDPTPRAGIDPTPGTPGLDTIFLKLALHEIGHTMGLGHVPDNGEIAGRTVMNSGAGVNDRLNNIPTEIKPCDRTGVSTHPNYVTPTPGGGGGGTEYTQSYCSSYFLVTDHYLCYADGHCDYWYSDYEYMGSNCMLVQ